MVYETGRRKNNRAENLHLPFQRREREMLRFRRMQSLQKLASVQGLVFNHFNLERHLYRRQSFKLKRHIALNDWRQLAS